jgi:hypothetical protein
MLALLRALLRALQFAYLKNTFFSLFSIKFASQQARLAALIY